MEKQAPPRKRSDRSDSDSFAVAGRDYSVDEECYFLLSKFSIEGYRCSAESFYNMIGIGHKFEIEGEVKKGGVVYFYIPVDDRTIYRGITVKTFVDGRPWKVRLGYTTEVMNIVHSRYVFTMNVNGKVATVAEKRIVIGSEKVKEPSYSDEEEEDEEYEEPAATKKAKVVQPQENKFVLPTSRQQPKPVKLNFTLPSATPSKNSAKLQTGVKEQSGTNTSSNFDYLLEGMRERYMPIVVEQLTKDEKIIASAVEKLTKDPAFREEAKKDLMSSPSFVASVRERAEAAEIERLKASAEFQQRIQERMIQLSLLTRPPDKAEIEKVKHLMQNKK